MRVNQYGSARAKNTKFRVGWVSSLNPTTIIFTREVLAVNPYRYYLSLLLLVLLKVTGVLFAG